jgi:hypothetical protein
MDKLLIKDWRRLNGEVVFLVPKTLACHLGGNLAIWSDACAICPI